MRISQKNDSVAIEYGTATVTIAPWGRDSLRVRMTREKEMDGNDWALSEEPASSDCHISLKEIEITEPWFRTEEERRKNTQKGTEAVITNGKITAKVSFEGWISFYNQRGELLTEEYWRNRNRIDRYSVPLRVDARELKPIPGTGDYSLAARFEAFDGERIYGMGQYQDRHLDKKGAVLELCHRNSQASVPFYISTRGYGFLWNNPAVGTVTFGTNRTEWTAQSTKKLDYFITAGDSPAEIEENYARATGFSPMMPEYGLGFWQCKLRYRNQEELMSVVRKHKRRGLPLDVVVVDFFHWTRQGDFRFEPRDWPDPEGMVKELRELGVELAVSVWPTIDEKSPNYGPMQDMGYLVQTDRASGFHMNWMGDTTFFDATHPGARQYVWERCKENYYDKGIRCFWLDEAEPEYGPYDFDVFRYYAGPALQCTNIYPVMYAKGFYEGLKSAGEKDVMSLVRCAWAGSQKYGALTWSGDIHSDFRAFREQLQTGLSMGLAGIPWWTSDIGGFVGGDGNDEGFRELLVRWFEWGAFCPVFRLHGERPPYRRPESEFIDGVRTFGSGQDNEVWSFGDDNYEIMKKFLFIRERLRDYIRRCMLEAHLHGTPVMRPVFFDFPEDSDAYSHEDEYMFGPDLLVAPIMEAQTFERPVYLPKGLRWKEASTGKLFDGGQTVTAQAPIDVIPVFIREGREYDIYN